jgi:hypothetical protein
VLHMIYNRLSCVTDRTGIDVGCAELILKDKVKVKSRCSIDHYIEDGVVLTDGTTIKVNSVIFAYVNIRSRCVSLPLTSCSYRTGYDDVRKSWKETFGDAIIDQAGEVWGLDHERELKGVYRPTGHPGVTLFAFFRIPR